MVILVVFGNLYNMWSLDLTSNLVCLWKVIKIACLFHFLETFVSGYKAIFMLLLACQVGKKCNTDQEGCIGSWNFKYVFYYEYSK